MCFKKFTSKDPTNGVHLSEIQYYRKNGNTEDIQVKLIYLSPYRVLRNLFLAVQKPESEFQQWVEYARHHTGFDIIDDTNLTPEQYYNKLKSAIASKRPIVPIIVFFRRFNGQNTLNEGRHRALASYDLKIKKIPIVDINKNYF